MNLSIEIDREDDGRWIAEALELPGVMTYGKTREEAISKTERLVPCPPEKVPTSFCEPCGSQAVQKFHGVPNQAVTGLAIEVIADRIEHKELPPSALNISFQAPCEQLAGH